MLCLRAEGLGFVVSFGFRPQLHLGFFLVGVDGPSCCVFGIQGIGKIHQKNTGRPVVSQPFVRNSSLLCCRKATTLITVCN